ncbi:MAG: hypothetical protein M2R45_02239 [Verrucomicrobia subdivision 3 bacterium]|nr:hypothetical protein [Limisphaerales bacterium]MCS1413975.1 hypothetical protein [Limisphaerales bacterium]
MLRFPDIGSSRIAFVYAGDLWTVEKEGDVARRLTSAKGAEVFQNSLPPANKSLSAEITTATLTCM